MLLVSFFIHGPESLRLTPYHPQNFGLKIKDVEDTSSNPNPQTAREITNVAEVDGYLISIVDHVKKFSRPTQKTVDKAKGVWKALENQAERSFIAGGFLVIVMMGVSQLLTYQKKSRLYVVASLVVSAVFLCLMLKSAKALGYVRTIKLRFENNNQSLLLAQEASDCFIMRSKMQSSQVFFKEVSDPLRYVTQKELDDLYIKYIQQWLQDNQDSAQWKSKLEKEQTPFAPAILQLFSSSSNPFIESIYKLFETNKPLHVIYNTEIKKLAKCAKCCQSTVENCLYMLFAKEINRVLEEGKEKNFHLRLEFPANVWDELDTNKVEEYLKAHPENKDWKTY